MLGFAMLLGFDSNTPGRLHGAVPTSLSQTG